MMSQTKDNNLLLNSNSFGFKGEEAPKARRSYEVWKGRNALSYLLMTASRDPGIVPRNSRPSELGDSLHNRSTSMNWFNNNTLDIRVPRTKDVIVNGHCVKVKYCDTCFLFRPPRASHCSICNNCVQRFDHHCPWIGQCVGVRNYRCFVLFISNSTSLCIYVFTFSVLDIFYGHGSLWSCISGNVISVILVFYCFIAVWFVGGLTVFHLYLMCKNKTTYENFRFRYDKKANPYDLGAIKNLKEVLLSKCPPSLVNFRKWVTEEDPILESINHKFVRDIINPKMKAGLAMGGMLLKDGKLQHSNVEYNGNNDEKRKEEKGGSIVSDPFVLSTIDKGNNNTQLDPTDKDYSVEEVKPEMPSSQQNHSAI